MYVDPQYFTHENDRKALDALKSIPGFNQLVKAFMKIYSERTMNIMNMSSKVRLSEAQCPRIYNLLPPICEKLGIPVPELYLEMDRVPNAYTYGDSRIFITVTSGLLEIMDEEEIQTVLAHECGHILCRHVLYHTVGKIILSGTAGLLGLGPLVTTAMSTAYFYWSRCSEFSADRAAALFCGSSERVVTVMMRLAGGSKDLADEINTELFLQQAEEYKGYVSDSKWNKVLEFLALMNATHPFLSVRAAAITEWCGTDGFMSLKNYMENGPAPGAGPRCPHCGSPADPRMSHCGACGYPLHQPPQGGYQQQNGPGYPMGQQPGFQPGATPNPGGFPQGNGGFYPNNPPQHPQGGGFFRGNGGFYPNNAPQPPQNGGFPQGNANPNAPVSPAGAPGGVMPGTTPPANPDSEGQPTPPAGQTPAEPPQDPPPADSDQ